MYKPKPNGPSVQLNEPSNSFLSADSSSKFDKILHELRSFYAVGALIFAVVMAFATTAAAASGTITVYSPVQTVESPSNYAQISGKYILTQDAPTSQSNVSIQQCGSSLGTKYSYSWNGDQGTGEYARVYYRVDDGPETYVGNVIITTNQAGDGIEKENPFSLTIPLSDYNTTHTVMIYFKDVWSYTCNGTGSNQITVTESSTFGEQTAKVTRLKCDMSVSSFTAPGSPFTPLAGDQVAFSGYINFTGTPSWTISIKDSSNTEIKTITGTGHSISTQWNGSGIPSGMYTATVTGRYDNQFVPEPCTTTSAPISFEIKSPPPEQCELKVKTHSTANVSNGNYAHSQELFAVKGGTLSPSATLYYNSLSPVSGVLGRNWSHNYEQSVVENADDSVLVNDENWVRPLYKKSGSTFSTPAGYTATLLKDADGSFTLTEPGGLVKRYYKTDGTGTSGKLQSITDRFGNSLTLIYDPVTYDLKEVMDTFQHKISFEYDTSVTPHLLKKIRDPKMSLDPALSHYTFDYDSLGRLEYVRYPVADKDPATEEYLPSAYWKYTYQGNTGLMLTKQDPKNPPSSYTYENGRIKTVVDPGWGSNPAGHSRTLLYATATGTDRTTTFTEKDGGVWTYTYDVKTGRLKTKIAPDDGKTLEIQRTTSNTYYSDGRKKSTTVPGADGSRFTTFYSYDGNGNIVTQSNALDLDELEIDVASVSNPATDSRIGVAYRYSYEPTGANRILQFRDERSTNHLVTSYVYGTENNGETVTVVGPDKSATITKYYPSGALKEVYDGNNTVVAADGTVSIKANAVKTAYVYRPDGLLQTVTAPDGTVTAYTDYDANGNNTELQVKDGSGAVRSTIVMVYDARNRLASSTVTATVNGQPTSATTTYGYDAVGNRIYLKDAEQHKTIYEYDYNGRLTKTTDALQYDTVYTYGGTGCPTCGGGVDKLTGVYDAKYAKNVPLESQPHTAYSYDKLGRLEYETDPITPGDPTVRRYRYTYYENGQVREKYDVTNGEPGVLLITYQYDSENRLIYKYYNGTLDPDVAYEYDANGRLQSAANGEIVYTYQYHPDGRFKSITDSFGRSVGTDQNQYDGLGQRKQVRISDGSEQRVVDYTYDSYNRPEHIISSAGNFSYDYDTLGRRWHTGYPTGIVATNLYDDLGRLTSISHKDGANVIASVAYTEFDKVGNRKARTLNGTQSEQYGYDDIYRLRTVTSGRPEAYTYDGVGNRKSGPGPKDTAYQPDAANRLIVGRKLTYGYDNAGNQITRAVPGAPEKGWQLFWDVENRLTSMEQTKGAERQTVTFAYDPFGKRIGKSLVAVSGGITKTSNWSYIYDGDNIALETYTDPNGNVEKTWYTHGAGTDEHLALERNGQYYYYHADGLGSITTITNSAKAPVQTYEYDSFGMAKPSTSFRNSYTYTGREWDKETGLYYYRARYYDPMEGRFISKDPIGFQGGINLYNYVASNPINNTDPTGLIVKKCFRPLKNAFTNYHQYLIVGGVPYGYFGESTVQSTDPLAGWGVHCVTITDDPCKEKCVKEKIKSFNPPTYGLLKYNCYSWVSDILSSCGL